MVNQLLKTIRAQSAPGHHSFRPFSGLFRPTPLEVGGDAAVYINPCDTADIARAINTITVDSDMRGSDMRGDFARRGRT
jgi:hypothetical protein